MHLVSRINILLFVKSLLRVETIMTVIINLNKKNHLLQPKVFLPSLTKGQNTLKLEISNTLNSIDH